MSEKTLKQAVDNWEKDANKLLEETREVGSLASKDLEKQIKATQVEGAKLIDSIKDGLGDADYKLGKELESRLIALQSKLTRAWEELNK
jgi:dipeptidase